MAKALTLPQAARLLLLILGTGFVLYFGGQLGEALMSDPTASTARRWLGVVISELSLAQWVAIVGWGALMGDEYHRRVVMVGTAIAFVAQILVHAGFTFLQDAHLVHAGTWLPTVPVAMLVWMAGVGLALLYYRVRA